MAMRGRQWSDGPIAMTFAMHAPSFEKGKSLFDYVGGVEDTLDGSHGPHFTYLPIVYQDDCQVCAGNSEFRVSRRSWYKIGIEFLVS